MAYEYLLLNPGDFVGAPREGRCEHFPAAAHPVGLDLVTGWASPKIPGKGADSSTFGPMIRFGARTEPWEIVPRSLSFGASA